MERYRRKVSREEARERYLLITKDAWGRFPRPGARFDLRVGTRDRRAVIRAVPCDRVGPWHEHYHLPLDEVPLVAGDTVGIARRGSGFELRTGQRAAPRTPRGR